MKWIPIDKERKGENGEMLYARYKGQKAILIYLTSDFPCWNWYYMSRRPAQKIQNYEWKDILILDESPTGYTGDDVAVEANSQDVEEKAKAYAADCMGEYDPELQDEFDDIVRHFIAGSNSNQQGGDARSCPCLYLDEPCQPHCTCKNGLWSHGCLYCCRYGSVEQRTEKAKQLAQILKAGYAAQSTPIPPGIVEQLRDKNPWNKTHPLQHGGYNECCDTLSSLISKQVDGIEERGEGKV
jgi:hypothetical protein